MNLSVRESWNPTRREFLGAAALAASACSARGQEPAPKKARIAITLDLEMSRGFPRRDDVEWDFEKGNLNAETKVYAVEAARRVEKQGGRIHFFVVGRVLEQESVEWLSSLAEDGHPLGNHTYDHVNVLADRLEDVQFRFRRAPWLVSGHNPAEVIRENIRLTTAALADRLEVEPIGFRTPGGFADGLAGRDDVQKMLLEQGFRWASSKYSVHPIGMEKVEPSADVIAGIVAAQKESQPFAYPSGLVEVPMSPISDVSAFRTGRWELPWFLRALQAAVEWTIAEGAVFDFLAHPSCLYVVDPQFQAIDLICKLVKAAGDRAELVTLDQIAAGVAK